MRAAKGKFKKRPYSVFLISCIAVAFLIHTASAASPDPQLQTLEKAHALFEKATSPAMYGEAAREYEYLVQEEGIRNGDLFYTLANTYFFSGDIGRAILNYRRAEQYIPQSEDLVHNLAFVQEQRIDAIPEIERPPLVEKLLGWHYNTPSTLRWWLFAAGYLASWIVWLGVRNSERNDIRITFAITVLLTLVLAASLITELVIQKQTEAGVILAEEVVARKGDGEIYAPAFLEPLHSGTEFQRLEDRGRWWHIRLINGETCWIPSTAADTVNL